MGGKGSPENMLDIGKRYSASKNTLLAGKGDSAVVSAKKRSLRKNLADPKVDGRIIREAQPRESHA